MGSTYDFPQDKDPGKELISPFSSLARGNGTLPSPQIPRPWLCPKENLFAATGPGPDPYQLSESWNMVIPLAT